LTLFQLFDNQAMITKSSGSRPVAVADSGVAPFSSHPRWGRAGDGVGTIAALRVAEAIGYRRRLEAAG
jgi:hypothetical protein